jgi:hypothetical protein
MLRVQTSTPHFRENNCRKHEEMKKYIPLNVDLFRA